MLIVIKHLIFLDVKNHEPESQEVSAAGVNIDNHMNEGSGYINSA